MAARRRNEKMEEGTSQGGVVDMETIAERIATSAIEALRKEVDVAIEKVVEKMKSHFTMELTEAVDHIYRRLDSVEQRLAVLEQKPDEHNGNEGMDVLKQEILEAKVVANDTEQYTRRHNIRILGLANQNDDYKECVVDFLKSKLKIQNIDKTDLEAAHPLPKRNKESSTDNGSQSVRTKPAVIVSFHSRDLRDRVIRQRRLLKGRNQTIIEDLTMLNVQTLNRARNSPEIVKTWTWNGRIYGINKDGQTLFIRPFQPINQCTVIS